MMETTTTQIILNPSSSLNLPTTSSSSSSQSQTQQQSQTSSTIPQKLSDVVSIAPTARIFSPPPIPTLPPPTPAPIAPPISKPVVISKPPPPKLPPLPLPQLPQMNGKVTYVVKTGNGTNTTNNNIIGPMNGMVSSSSTAGGPSYTICRFRPIRPVGSSMVQNPFRPGMYIRSPNKFIHHQSFNYQPRMQGIIRVIQPAKYPIMVSTAAALPPPRPQPPPPPPPPKPVQTKPFQIQIIQAAAQPPKFSPPKPQPQNLVQIPQVTPQSTQPPPPPKKVVSPPKEYPGEAKTIFTPSVDRPARLTPINWKQFREDYKQAKKGEVKVLKPWDIHYQPLTTKQRAAKTILNVEKFPQATSISLNSQIGPANGPLTEKNISIDGSSPKKKQQQNHSFSSSSPEKVVKIKKRKIKDEANDREEEDKEPEKKKFKKYKKIIKKELIVKQEIIEPLIFPLRSMNQEIDLTVGEIHYTAEDHVYNHIAFNRLLAEGYLNFLADLRLPNDPEDLGEMLAMIKIANARNFKTAAYLDGKTKKSKIAPVISKFLPLPDLPTEEEEKINPLETGCARVRPFIRKISLSPIKKRVGKRFTVITKEDEENMKRAQERGKHERHLTRQMLTQLQIEQPELAKLDIFKTNNTAFHKFLKHAKSPIHGDGLFALAPIEPDQLIIEYTGEKIRHEIANIRERRYEKQGVFSSYMFRLDDDWVVDATKMGNLARYINHCCQPNCTARIISRNGVKRIFIFSKTFIEKGEKLTYDYKFPFEDNKIRCHCGAKFCRNYLN